MSGDDVTLTIHPAGRDEELAAVIPDLQIAHWRSTKALLATTGRNWALRTTRSQVIAAVDPGGDSIRAWCREEPRNPDALMMWARVLTERLLAAGRGGTVKRDVVERARWACTVAAQAHPDDPVPWVCLLALAVLDNDPMRPHRRENWAACPDRMLPHGPWPLLKEVVRRQPDLREAYVRLYQCFHARRQGPLAVACWATQAAPPASPVLPLALYAYATEAADRLVSGRSGGTAGFWQTGELRYYTERVRDLWFYRLINPARDASLTDLNHLAYALTATGLPGAHDVFEAIGSYATPSPWEGLSHSGHWQEDFKVARRGAFRMAQRQEHR